MAGRVGRLVQVDHAGVDIRLQITLQRSATSRDGGEMTRSDED